MIDKSIIHLWSNNAFHDEAYIVCNKKGLRQLRDELNRMLEQEVAHGEIETMCNDGEGYDLHVIVAEGPDGWMPVETALPYIDEDFGAEKRANAVYPWMHRERE